MSNATEPTTATVKAEVMSIDPATATAWLATNTNNRTLRREHVDSLARDMAAGGWHLNGEPIKFSVDGVLLDGQHRLRAVVKSGSTIQALVVWGLAPQTQDSMDTGSKRTAADMLALHGEKNTALLAATIRLAVQAEVYGALQGGPTNRRVTNREIANYLSDHPQIELAVNHARRVARDLDCPASVIGYALWVLMSIDAQEAFDFFTDASQRVGLEAGDPVLALGRRFAEARRNREFLPTEVRISMIYRAWNARRAGRPLTVLRANSNSARGGAVEIPVPR